MMSDKKRGALVVISGPSGAGKTSICKELLRRIPDSRWSVSVMRLACFSSINTACMAWAGTGQD